MPSTVDKNEIKLRQLIPPRPQPTRGKPFPLSCSEEWFIYPHGSSVYLYNLNDPTLSKEYREHAYPVGVAKLSPTGAFVASGDQNGNLRIWSTSEGLETKLEIRALGGRVNDLQWSEDEKYVSLCGEGRDQFANIVKVDGGASFGELSGPTKTCSSITLKSGHLLLASDDKSVTIYRAAPTFKFVRSLRDHDNFVQVVRFNGDGTMFASAGSDGKVIIYSTIDYNQIKQFKAHESGILGMEWINNETILTASSDKSLKLWHIPEGTLISQSEVSKEWNFEKQICGIEIIGTDRVLVLRLDGSLELVSIADLKALNLECLNGIGHAKGIVDLVFSDEDHVAFSVSYDGNLKSWETKNLRLLCKNESNLPCKNVQKLINSTCAISENKIISIESEVELSSKIIGFSKYLLLTSDGNLISQGKVIKATGIKGDLAAFSSEGVLAVYTGSSLKFYNAACELIESIDDIPAKITAMSFNESGTALATADDQRRIKVYAKETTGTSWTRKPSQWCNHAARIDTLLWFDEGTILSAGVDGHIMAWSQEINKVGPIGTVKSAHSGPINKLTKLGEKVFASVASDSCLKIWTL